MLRIKKLFCLPSLFSIRGLGLAALLLLISNSYTYAQQEDSTQNTVLLPKADSIALEIPKEDKAGKPKASSKISAKHSPQKAILFGAIFPGGGQIYNRKYWKLPIVYAGFGGLGYLAYFNGRQYQCYRKAYLAEVDNDPLTVNTCDTDLSTAELKIARNQFQTYYEYSILGVAGFYVLTLVDAFVDAHLMTFDVSDDLSMSIRPKVDFNTPSLLSSSPMTASIGLRFHWKNSPSSPQYKVQF